MTQTNTNDLKNKLILFHKMFFPYKLIKKNTLYNFFLFIFSKSPSLPFFIEYHLHIPIFSIHALYTSFLGEVHPLSPLILVRLCCRSFFFFVTFSIIHTALNVCTPKKIQNISTSLFLAFYSVCK